MTLLYGVLLVLLGVGCWLATDRASATALIPAGIGALVLVCWASAGSESRRALWMHVAAILALLALVGTAAGVPKAFRHLTGETLERPAAALEQAVAALLSLVYLGFGFASFVRARRARKGRAEP